MTSAGTARYDRIGRSAQSITTGQRARLMDCQRILGIGGWHLRNRIIDSPAPCATAQRQIEQRGLLEESASNFPYSTRRSEQFLRLVTVRMSHLNFSTLCNRSTHRYSPLWLMAMQPLVMPEL